MSPRHLKPIDDHRWQITVNLPVETKRKVFILMKTGRYEYFTDIVIDAVDKLLKREMRNIKYKGKRNGTNRNH